MQRKVGRRRGHHSAERLPSPERAPTADPFCGDEQHEFTSPEVPDHGVCTADVPLVELELTLGAKIAYVFDFGDEWRVRLTLKRTGSGNDGGYPRVLQRTGEAPPQYPPLDDD